MKNLYNYTIASLLMCVLLVASGPAVSVAQVTLSPGDLVFTGINLFDDDQDGQARDNEFSFVLLKDVPAGSQIYFTDLGLVSGNTLQPAASAKTDGIIMWTAPEGGVAAGINIMIEAKYKLTATIGTITPIRSGENPDEFLSLGLGSDQLFAFTGSPSSPSFIAGISLNTDWVAELSSTMITSSQSMLPPALEGPDAQSLILNTGGAAGIYNASIDDFVLSPHPEETIAYYNDPANWISDSTAFPEPLPPAYQLPKLLAISGDQRLLVSNQGEYIFEGQAFGKNHETFDVKIQGVPGEGQLNAGSGDIFPVTGIINGQLSYDPLTTGHGYEYAAFSYVLLDANGVESKQSYTLTIDLAAAGTELTGSEGWFTLATAAASESLADFLDPVWTQGIPGSDFPSTDFASVYLFNNSPTVYTWEKPENMSLTPRGQGLLTYVFADDNYDGSPNTFPKTITSSENWNTLKDEFAYAELAYSSSSPNDFDPAFNFLGNPHPISLDFCVFVSTNVAESIDIWDPLAGGNNGSYVNLNCLDPEVNVHISPYQAFWVRTTDTVPALSVPEAAYLGLATDGTGQKSTDEASSLISLHLNDLSGTFTDRINLHFSPEATHGMDAADAPKLSPEGLAQRWVSFYALDDQKRAYTFRSLPNDFRKGEAMDIPLDITTTEQGFYTIEWANPTTSAYVGGLLLKDNLTGTITDLQQADHYTFEISDVQTIKGAPRGNTNPSIKPTAMKAQPGEARFTLMLRDGGGEDVIELPEAIALEQNYPNPFNPSTNITFALPEDSRVRITVYDIMGRMVATLVDDTMAAGRHNIQFDASHLASGIYLYRMQAGSASFTKKLTLIK